MSRVTRSLEAHVALTAPIEIPFEVAALNVVEVKYSVTIWDDGLVIRVSVAFDAEHDNTSFHTLTDLPYGLPDAPQWFMDAVEAMEATR